MTLVFGIWMQRVVHRWVGMLGVCQMGIHELTFLTVLITRRTDQNFGQRLNGLLSFNPNKQSFEMECIKNVYHTLGVLECSKNWMFSFVGRESFFYVDGHDDYQAKGYGKLISRHVTSSVWTLTFKGCEWLDTDVGARQGCIILCVKKTLCLNMSTTIVGNSWGTSISIQRVMLSFVWEV